MIKIIHCTSRCLPGHSRSPYRIIAFQKSVKVGFDVFAVGPCTAQADDGTWGVVRAYGGVRTPLTQSDAIAADLVGVLPPKEWR